MDYGKRKIMVAMALAATAIGLPAADRQLYGATFEDVLNTDSGSMNDFSYVVNRPILDAAFRGIEDGEAFGWLGRSIVDEWNDDSMIALRSDASGGQALRLNTEGGTLTYRLKVSTSAALRAAIGTGSVYFEADVKFRPTDAISDVGIMNSDGVGTNMFSIFAYCPDEGDYYTPPTRLVVFHAYYDPNDPQLSQNMGIGYTNEVFSTLINPDDYTKLRIEMRQTNVGGTPMNVFSVSVDGTVVTSATAYQDGCWFLGADGFVPEAGRLSVVSVATAISFGDYSTVYFQGMGWIDNIGIGVVGQPTDAVTVDGVSIPCSWLSGEAAPILAAHNGDYVAAANATAANGLNKVWECYVAGISPTNAASSFRTVISFADGKPVIRWDPDLNDGEPGSGRVYRVEGKEKLSDDWAPTNSASRFFRVKVGMP